MKKRCDMCAQKKDLFAYDGMKLCGSCKGTMSGCDNRQGTGTDVPTVLTGRAAASRRMMEAKRK